MSSFSLGASHIVRSRDVGCQIWSQLVSVRRVPRHKRVKQAALLKKNKHILLYTTISQAGEEEEKRKNHQILQVAYN